LHGIAGYRGRLFLVSDEEGEDILEVGTYARNCADLRAEKWNESGR
jgi:hypothetical protein